jgi:hypothetical protein
LEKLNDLRFIIGLFFAMVGVLLFVLSFALHYEKPFGQALNHFGGAAMLVFGLFMLWLSRRG